MAGLALLLLLSGCQSGEQMRLARIASTAGAPPLAALLTPSPAPLPVFLDEFGGPLDPGWSWQDEDTSRWNLEGDGWLAIKGAEGSIVQGESQANILWRSLPGGSFEVSIHLASQPLFDSQRAGLLLYHDPQHYIALSQGYCSECVLGGTGVFLEYQLGSEHGRYSQRSSTTDLYLMLLDEPGIVSGFYAIQEGQWQHLASIPNSTVFQQVGLSVTSGHAGEQGDGLLGRFDYFRIALPQSLAPTPTPVPWPQA
jgi:beta-xylosidase